MSALAIEVAGLCKNFGTLAALTGVDLAVTSGEIMGLIGPDGAGKTTTMRILAGVILAGSGTVRIAGLAVGQAAGSKHFSIGYMPQRFSLYTDLTVAENMRFFADLYGVVGEAYQQRYEELMHFSRLLDHSYKMAGSLSGGMQKKLALSCNLLHKPQVLLLDEPTNGVDPVSRRELWGLLYELKAGGTTILVSTPYMDEAERCSRVTFMHAGKVIACDKPETLMQRAGAAAAAEVTSFGAVFSWFMDQTRCEGR